MFFIGIFGIQDAQKSIGSYNNTICPSCSALTRFEVLKAYTYFHIFFIPTFKWNVRYYVKPVCCGSIYELDPVVGQQYEKGLTPEIRNEHMRPVNQHLPFKTCSSCRARTESGYSFCPHCGARL
jgi:hypothetical protein